MWNWIKTMQLLSDTNTTYENIYEIIHSIKILIM